ncbi:hypothetical protein [Sedimenticola sp.]|uniref:hypothetical protein n=1 Tax=Sedimenticola sp. TaxID=1940285 RepID=UPI003D12B458
MCLIVGAVAWEHPEWCDQFYPDDLPPEWRLTYYANEFPQLLLPAAVWMAGRTEQFCDWRDDVPDGFRFVLDVTGLDMDDGRALTPLQRGVSALGERLAGVVSWSAVSSRAEDALRVLLGEARFLAARTGLTSMDPEVQLARDGEVWCLLVPSSVGRDLKRLRWVLGALIQQSTPLSCIRLFVTGEPPEVQVMRETGVLWQLLAGLER